MRRILFRGQTNDEKWVYGDYSLDKDGICIVQMDTKTEVNYNTIGQFTGLYDKNDKEIFEGDIIRRFDLDNNEIIYIIIFDEEMGAFVAKKPILKLRSYINQDTIYNLGFEIIGNIYDNKNLLNN